MTGYLPRIVDAELAELLSGTRAVSVEGPRAVGKTVTASRLAKSIVRLDDPAARQLLAADREAYLSALASPVLVDEWQLDPPTWDTIRRLIDRAPERGRFLLTGSADPGETSLHSGAGRFVRLRMRPLSFAERAIWQPSVSLSSLWDTTATISGATQVSLRDYAEEIATSGFPGLRGEPSRVRARGISDYIAYALEHDAVEFGEVRHRPAALRDWLTAYAAATSSTASFEAIAAATARSAPPSRKTILDYRDVLRRLWLLDEVPAWLPGSPRLNKLGHAPKHHLADPALAATLLGADANRLVTATSGGDTDPSLRTLHDGPLFGALFESLVTQSARVYAQASEAEVSHLRTHNGQHEIDLILHRTDGTAIALEVKLAAEVSDRDVRHLNWLKEQMGERLVQRAVITTGSGAYRRDDGVAIIPLALLGP